MNLEGCDNQPDADAQQRLRARRDELTALVEGRRRFLDAATPYTDFGQVSGALRDLEAGLFLLSLCGDDIREAESASAPPLHTEVPAHPAQAPHAEYERGADASPRAAGGLTRLEEAEAYVRDVLSASADARAEDVISRLEVSDEDRQELYLKFAPEYSRWGKYLDPTRRPGRYRSLTEPARSLAPTPGRYRTRGSDGEGQGGAT